MSIETNYQNPNEMVVSGRNADGVLVKMASITATFDDTSGKDVVTLVVTPEAGMTLAGVTPPVTITQPE